MENLKTILEDYGFQMCWGEGDERKVLGAKKEKDEKHLDEKGIKKFIFWGNIIIVDLEKFTQRTKCDQRIMCLKQEIEQEEIAIETNFNDDVYYLDIPLRILSGEIRDSGDERKIAELVEGYELRKLFDQNLKSSFGLKMAIKDELVKIQKSAENGLVEFTKEMKALEKEYDKIGI